MQEVSKKASSFPEQDATRKLYTVQCLRNALEAISDHPRRQPVHHRRQVVNREEIGEYLQAVLDGRRPCRAISQIERELGVGSRTIESIFPLESSLVSRQHKAQRAQAWRQHIARVCDEVRQVASALHAQRIYPSRDCVKSRLSMPNMMRMPEVDATWHAVLCELGFKERINDGFIDVLN